jgi:hypothetical protein
MVNLDSIIQVIILKHNYDLLINNIPLINYVLMTTNMRLLISESRDNSNQCTSCKGNPTNMPHVSHAQSLYDPRSYVSHAVNA